VILMASVSEVEPCVEAQKVLWPKRASMPAWCPMPAMDLFDAQSDEYKESVLPKLFAPGVAGVEAASPMSWYKYVGLDGEVIGMTHLRLLPLLTRCCSQHRTDPPRTSSRRQSKSSISPLPKNPGPPRFLGAAAPFRMWFLRQVV
jgi:hypothetical protein